MGIYKQLFDVYSKYYDTSGEAFTTLKEQLSRQSDNQVIDRKISWDILLLRHLSFQKARITLPLFIITSLESISNQVDILTKVTILHLMLLGVSYKRRPVLIAHNYFTNMSIYTTNASHLTLACNIYPKTQRSKSRHIIITTYSIYFGVMTT